MKKTYNYNSVFTCKSYKKQLTEDVQVLMSKIKSEISGSFLEIMLKLNTFHQCFLAVYKAELNAMLHRIQISTNTCEVTMQVKRAMGKAILHKLPIYNEYMQLC